MGLNAVAGLAYSPAEWATEWQSLVDMASAHPRNPSANSYQSLEEVIGIKSFKFYLTNAAIVKKGNYLFSGSHISTSACLVSADYRYR